jgi:hypothetical protein
MAIASIRGASRLLRIKTEETFGTPADTAPKFYDLYESSDASYLVVHSRLDDQGRRRRQKAKLDSACVQKVMDRFRVLSVPVCPQVMMGCDGGYTTLFIGDSKFYWWSCPPKGWETMSHLTKELLDIFKSALHPEETGEGLDAAADIPSSED